MKKYRLLILLIIGAAYTGDAHAQDDKRTLSNTALLPGKDSSVKKAAIITDTVRVAKTDTVKKHNPRVATFRSAVLPGWGQAYNKQYWKIPVVYGILAIPTALYFYNNSYYKKTKFAYEARFKAANNGDSSDIKSIDPELSKLGIADLQNYRNVFRRDRDYSVLYFILAWGLQVADATVFAHLKEFNVSNELSMQVNPSFNPVTRSPSLNLTLNLRNASSRKVIAR